jgi:hypothetical protein
MKFLKIIAMILLVLVLLLISILLFFSVQVVYEKRKYSPYKVSVEDTRENSENEESEVSEEKEKISIELREDVIVDIGDNSTLKAYKSYLLKNQPNKAFAISNYGDWGRAYDKVNENVARDIALRYCNRNKHERVEPCRVVDVNGAYIGLKDK